MYLGIMLLLRNARREGDESQCVPSLGFGEPPEPLDPSPCVSCDLSAPVRGELGYMQLLWLSVGQQKA